MSSVREPTEQEKENAEDTEFYGSATRDWFEGLSPVNEDDNIAMDPDALKLMLLKHAISKIKKQRKAKDKGKVPV